MVHTNRLVALIAALAGVGCGNGATGPQPAPDGAVDAVSAAHAGNDVQSTGRGHPKNASMNRPADAGSDTKRDARAQRRPTPDAGDAGISPDVRDAVQSGDVVNHGDAAAPDAESHPVDATPVATDAEPGTPPNPCAGVEPTWKGPIHTEEVQITTADHVTLAATAWAPKSGTCLSAILLVHQFQLSRHQWDAKALDLASTGRVILAIDLRGHGDSDPVSFPLAELLTAPDQAPLDVSAALDWLKTRPSVDTTRIAVVGTSIGANLAVVAALGPQPPRAVVAVSPRLQAIAALADAPPANVALGATPVLCLAAELDNGGVQAATCEALVATSTHPASKALVFPSVSHHGIALLNVVDGAWDAVASWLDATL